MPFLHLIEISCSSECKCLCNQNKPKVIQKATVNPNTEKGIPHLRSGSHLGVSSFLHCSCIWLKFSTQESQLPAAGSEHWAHRAGEIHIGGTDPELVVKLRASLSTKMEIFWIYIYMLAELSPLQRKILIFLSSPWDTDFSKILHASFPSVAKQLNGSYT